ncbi:hypothetical protein AURDEDRAFT_94875 [Auricularia subglabra TFB-10046 SS5]|nr:hypothetical protein AURDEDRAFT_94875 [Auricularia subglabra TFB-10046 SS5]
MGEHTVRISPISTATLNPYMQTFCLAAPSYAVFVPVVFNNTKPRYLQYSLAPLADPSAKTIVELSAKDLKNIDQSIMSTPPAPVDVDDEDEPTLIDFGAPQLGKTEVMHHLKITKPGIVALERAGEGGNVDIRVRQRTVSVVDCPRAHFVDKAAAQETRCVGASHDLGLTVYGVPPLALTWTRTVDDAREEFVVEGIDGPNGGESSSGPAFSGARAITIPLAVALDRLGTHTYALESVSDLLGNAVPLHARPPAEVRRAFAVLRRPEVSFAECGAGRPVPLRKGGAATLKLRTHAADGRDAPWQVTLASSHGKKINVEMRDANALGVDVREQGEYTILDVKGRYCTGDVLSPESCRVAEMPVPSAEIKWEKIHECSGDTGVSASLVLHGTPPFAVQWTAQQKGKGRETTHTKTFSGSRGAFTIQPEASGAWRYAFTRLSDANYKDLKLDGPAVELSVHPTASAKLVRGRKERDEVYSCAGSEVEVEVDLKGSAPWKLEVQVLGPKGSKTIPYPNLREPRAKLQVPIPREIDADGGAFQIDLVTVEDAHGCKLPVSDQGMSVKVKRAKPTIRFYSKDGVRRVTIHQGEEARLPLRLTGDGPWDVRYRLQSQPEVYTARVAANNANAELRVRRPGVYELLSIKDKHCPGTVSETEAQYEVLWVPRPSVKLASTTAVSYIASNDSYVRAPVCEGVLDAVDLELDGVPPFKIKYNIGREDEFGVMKVVADDATVGSIQKQMRFALDTSAPGRVLYQVRDVGDARYPLRTDTDHPIGLQFEQEILERPSAAFAARDRLSYCLGDALEPQAFSDAGLLRLRGAPPFALDVSIRTLATSEVRRETVWVPEHEWRLRVPGFAFTSVGQHLVEIEGLRDRNGCEHAPFEPGKRSVWVDVAETAAIFPLESRRADYCVGDLLGFQLEGIPPWHITYNFLGTTRTATEKQPLFKRLAGDPGIFKVLSIGHQTNMCQTPVNDLELRIHDIPSAKVSKGNKVIEDIREGDQAEILFTFSGEPPFTFTYQRAEIARKGQKAKVLETHTVSGVMTNEYSIYSAVEGTWTVTFISDKWCRFPPAQVDATVEKA